MARRASHAGGDRLTYIIQYTSRASFVSHHPLSRHQTPLSRPPSLSTHETNQPSSRAASSSRRHARIPPPRVPRADTARASHSSPSPSASRIAFDSLARVVTRTVAHARPGGEGRGGGAAQGSRTRERVVSRSSSSRANPRGGIKKIVSSIGASTRARRRASSTRLAREPGIAPPGSSSADGSTTVRPWRARRAKPSRETTRRRKENRARVSLARTSSWTSRTSSPSSSSSDGAVGDPCSRVSGCRELFIALVVWCMYAHCGHFKTMYVKERVRRWTGGWLTRTRRYASSSSSSSSTSGRSPVRTR